MSFLNDLKLAKRPSIEKKNLILLAANNIATLIKNRLLCEAKELDNSQLMHKEYVVYYYNSHDTAYAIKATEDTIVKETYNLFKTKCLYQYISRSISDEALYFRETLYEMMVQDGFCISQYQLMYDRTEGYNLMSVHDEVFNRLGIRLVDDIGSQKFDHICFFNKQNCIDLTYDCNEHCYRLPSQSRNLGHFTLGFKITFKEK